MLPTTKKTLPTPNHAEEGIHERTAYRLQWNPFPLKIVVDTSVFALKNDGAFFFFFSSSLFLYLLHLSCFLIPSI